MTLGEKIFHLRKRRGWSQEELAEKCDVSRQSVSKWESGQSAPDLDKILLLSDIFQVSTDYLLRETHSDNSLLLNEKCDASGSQIKEESFEEDTGEASGFTNKEEQAFHYEETDIRMLAPEEADAYLDTVEAGAHKISFGVFLCIISPVTLILLAVLSERGMLVYESSDGSIWSIGGGIGIVVLLALVAVAVFLFITAGAKLGRFEYLEKEPFALDYELERKIRAEKEEFDAVFTKMIAVGVVLIILAVAPLILAACLSGNEFLCGILTAVMLALIAVGVYLCVWAGMHYDSYQKLLQQEDYSRENKKASGLVDKVGAVYWPCIVAIYLGYSFVTGNWAFSWIVWPVAGVAFAAVTGVCRLVNKEK